MPSAQNLIIFLFLVTSCAHKKDLKPKNALFLQNNKNWSAVYERELKSALENEDHAAFYFFWPEYLKALEEQ